MGAGIAFDNAADSSIIDGNIIVNNTANITCRGGGINLWMSNIFVTNNIISENWGYYGGGIYIGSCEPSVVNNTIINNNANYGGGIYFRDSNAANVMNTILWGNQASTGPQIRIYGTSSVEVAYCDIQGGWSPGTNIINLDPQFEPGDSLYHLSSSSPCINKGIDSMLLGGIMCYCPCTDFEDDPRMKSIKSL